MWRPLVENRMRRCVVIVSGFFEWTSRGRADATKQPHFVRRRDGQLMMLAGLYDVFTPPSATPLDFAADDGREADEGGNEFVVSSTDPLHSFSIITMRASKEIRFLHDRMPCILQSDEEVDLWLNSEDPFQSLSRILRAFPAADLEIYQVPPLVNQLSNRGPQCIMPAAEHARSSGIASFFRRSAAIVAVASSSDTTPQLQGAVTASPVSSPGAPPLTDDVAPDGDDDDNDDDEKVRSLIIVDEDDPDLKLALELSALESAPSSGASSSTTKRKRASDQTTCDDDDDDNDKPRSAPSKSKFDFRQFLAANQKSSASPKE
jgi:putative SOS response-associated peptidase YedK